MGPSALPACLLVVDDDPVLRGLVVSFLQREGYAVLEADGPAAARRQIAARHVDVVVLDVMMPGEDGLSLARSLATGSDVGIIFVSARGGEADRIIGLDLGADDYLAKPVSPSELLARIRAVLRRRARPAEHAQRVPTYRFSGWQLDPVQRTLRDPGGVVISLSAGEFKLLLALVEQPGEVLSRDRLLELAHGEESEAFDRAIDTQVSRLRRKLLSRAPGELIRTIRNEGYVFLPEVTRQ